MQRRTRRRTCRSARAFLPTLETLEPRALLDASVVISELVASNRDSLLDEDGESSDWIELMNVSAAPVSVEGWHLTDDPQRLDKWSLPRLSLQPGETLLVFASSKDRDNPTRPLHTNFRLDADGEYLALTRPDLTVEDEIAPAYPPQVTDVSYGVPAALNRAVLVGFGAAGRLLVPSDGSLDPTDVRQGEIAGSWLDPTLDTSAAPWQSVTTGIGFRDEGADPNPDPGEGLLVADSVAEFSSFQNRDNWRYGYWDRSADADGVYDAASSDFKAFSWTGLTTISAFNHWDGSKWDLAVDTAPKTELSAEGGHPAGSNSGGPVHLPVRRWTSEVTGTVLVHGELSSEAGGDGVMARILVDGQEVYSRAVAGTSRSYQAIFTVQQGDLVDFLIDPGAADNDTGDQTRFTIQIEDITALVGPGGPLPSLADEISTDIQAQMKGIGSSAYLRIPFTPADVQFDALTLNVKYDDAFVAYLNGQLIASAGLADPLSAAWNSTAVADRTVDEALREESFDVTSAKDLLITGATNVLMIQTINFSSTNADLLMAPELVGVRLLVSLGQHQYFVTPTPGTENGFGDSQVGPLLIDRDHQPAMPARNEPLVVTVQVAESFHPVSRVDVSYRAMYGGTSTLPMRDDGVGADATAGDGIYSATIPAGIASSGQMIRWYFTARDNQGQASRYPRFDDPLDSEEYFGTVVADPGLSSNLPIIHWFVQSRSAAMSGGGARGSLFYDGEFYDNVRFDLHGQSSSGFPTTKKSMNVDLPRDHRFRWADGLPRMKDFDLLTNFADKSKLRNTLAYEQHRIIGDAYHLAYPVRVQHNGSFFAVYDFVEDGDDRWLERLGFDPDGALYKMYNRLDSPTGEKKTRRDEGNADLQALVDGSRLTGQARTRFIYDNVNLPALANYLASFVITSNQDCCHKNYYLYRDTNGTAEWQFMPWDVDLTQGRNWGGFGLAYFDDTMYPNNPLFMGTNNQLISALYNTPGFREMYLRRVRSLIDLYVKPPGTPADQLPLETRVDELVALMASDAALDNQLHRATWGQTGFQTFEQATQILKNEYAGPRREFLYNTQVTADSTALRRLISGDVGQTAVRYFVPSNNNLGQTWTQLGFDDASWASGATGIGYENAPPGYEDLLATDVGGLMTGRTSIYLRSDFQLATLDDIPLLTLRMKYDDGFIAYLNGVEVARRGVGNGAPSFDMTSTSHSDTAAVQFEDIDISSFRDRLRVGRNVLAIQGVNTNSTSSDFLILPELVVGRPTGASGPIPLAQMGNPTIDFGAIEFNPASGNQEEEYVELINRNPVAVDLSGWRVDGAIQMTFRPGTVLPSGWSLYLTPNAVAFRARATGPSGGQGLFVQGNYSGHLSNFGETLSLFGADGQRVSEMTYTGDPTVTQQFLRISEVMYNPLEPDARERSINAGWASQDFEFVELRNTSPDVSLDLSGVRFSNGVDFDFASSPIQTLAPQSYTLIVRNQPAFLARYGNDLADQIAGTFQLASGLGNDGEAIKLDDATGSTVVEFTYSDDADRGWPTRADGRGSSLELTALDGDPGEASSWSASRRIHGTPGSGVDARGSELQVNELLARPAAGQVDAVELLNTGGSELSVSGDYFLATAATSLDALGQFPLPATQLPAGGRLVVDGTSLGTAEFALDGMAGGEVYLTYGQGGTPTHFVDLLTFGPTAPGQSWGRTPDGSVYTFGLASLTLGGANSMAQIGPLVISELHYHPAAPGAAALAADPNIGRDDLEFIEIGNPTAQAVSLAQWRLRGDVDYDFADDVTLGPGRALLVLPFNPANPANATRLAAFRAEYGISLNTTLLGGYAGQLNDAGDRVTLQRSGAADDPQATQPVRLIADEILFTDEAPWPTDADGLGDSLQRTGGVRVGRDPAAWQVAPPTPGQFDLQLTQPGDFNGDRVVDLADLELICAALTASSQDPQFDLTGDGQLNSEDRDRMVYGELRTTYGDANLDREFNSTDLVTVFAAGRYEDGIAGNATWAQGDWNCDGDFESGDLVLAFSTGAYEQGPLGARAAVTTHSELRALDALFGAWDDEWSGRLQGRPQRPQRLCGK